MGSAESLAAWGVRRPADVVAIAAAVGLSLPAAATLLEKESGGGRNVWGSDPVPTGGAYTKGGEVTEANYLAYRRALAAGTAGAQGVGPCQLTWRGYQDAADRLGGCWRWDANVRVGFATLRDLQAQHGVRGGFRRYNGSGPMAERYADDAMVKLARWTDRLGTPTPSPIPRPVEDDMTPEQDRMLREVHAELFRRHPTRADYRLVGESEPGVRPSDTAAGFAINADARAYETRQLVQQLRAELASLTTRPGLSVDEVRGLLREALADVGPLYLTPTPEGA